jgi:hypothetical protein
VYILSRPRHGGPSGNSIEQGLRHSSAGLDCCWFLHLDRGLLRACIGRGQAGQGRSESSSFADYRGWIVELGDLRRPGAVECVRPLFPSSEGMAEPRARSTRRLGLYKLPLHAPSLFRRAWGIAGERCVCHAGWGIWLTPSMPIVTARPCSAAVPLPSSIFVGVDVTAPRTHRPSCFLLQLFSLRSPPWPIALHGGYRAPDDWTVSHP